jgi:hypothetical protein
LTIADDPSVPLAVVVLPTAVELTADPAAAVVPPPVADDEAGGVEVLCDGLACAVANSDEAIAASSSSAIDGATTCVDAIAVSTIVGVVGASDAPVSELTMDSGGETGPVLIVAGGSEGAEAVSSVVKEAGEEASVPSDRNERIVPKRSLGARRGSNSTRIGRKNRLRVRPKERTAVRCVIPILLRGGVSPIESTDGSIPPKRMAPAGRRLQSQFARVDGGV